MAAGARTHLWGGVSPFKMHYSIAFQSPVHHCAHTPGKNPVSAPDNSPQNNIAIIGTFLCRALAAEECRKGTIHGLSHIFYEVSARRSTDSSHDEIAQRGTNTLCKIMYKQIHTQ